MEIFLLIAGLIIIVGIYALAYSLCVISSRSDEKTKNLIEKKKDEQR
jgi:hypothetical protein